MPLPVPTNDSIDDERPYRPPFRITSIGLNSLLNYCGRASMSQQQLALLQSDDRPQDVPVFYSGSIELLKQPCVSIVGAREVSREGAMRARRLARELIQRGVVVVSGLARGVDAASHESAIEAGGRTIAVIGTPVDKVYPVENAALQEEIYSHHLLVSPFPIGEPTRRHNFPKRNRVMAALSDATVIIEASDTSGTLHQAAECQRLGRWLFITKSVVEDERLTWPRKFLSHSKTVVLSSTTDILERIIR